MTSARTPQAARDMLCPLSFNRDKMLKCQSDKCALWRWSEKEREHARDAHFLDAMREMGVDPAGAKRPTPNQVKQAKQTADDQMRDWTGETGFCALAGE